MKKANKSQIAEKTAVKNSSTSVETKVVTQPVKTTASRKIGSKVSQKKGADKLVGLKVKVAKKLDPPKPEATKPEKPVEKPAEPKKKSAEKKPKAPKFEFPASIPFGDKLFEKIPEHIDYDTFRKLAEDEKNADNLFVMLYTPDLGCAYDEPFNGVGVPAVDFPLGLDITQPLIFRNKVKDCTVQSVLTEGFWFIIPGDFKNYKAGGVAFELYTAKPRPKEEKPVEVKVEKKPAEKPVEEKPKVEKKAKKTGVKISVKKKA